MCPSYMATGEEKHSTRGRAHLLWEMMQGEVARRTAGKRAVKESLDLCLSCKACKSECPTSVDMATYKAEFLVPLLRRHASRPLSHYAFGHIDRWARLASMRRPATRWPTSITQRAVALQHLQSRLQASPERRLPAFRATQSFATRERRAATRARRRHGDVLLWADTFNELLPSRRSREAALDVLTARASASACRNGMSAAAGRCTTSACSTRQGVSAQILDALSAELGPGTPIVVLEPSCATRLPRRGAEPAARRSSNTRSG